MAEAYNPEDFRLLARSGSTGYRGFAHLIGGSRARERFVEVLDDVQYSRGNWRNRNRIKTLQGLQWLTTPVRFNLADNPCVRPHVIVRDLYERADEPSESVDIHQ